MTKSFVKDLFKYLPAQIVPAIVGFISISIITRIFLPDSFGNYQLVLSTIMIFSVLMGWVDMSLLRFYPAYERDRKTEILLLSLLKWFLLSLFLIVFLFVIFVQIFKGFLSTELYKLMMIGNLSFIFLSFFHFGITYLRIKKRVGLYSIFFSWKAVSMFGIGLFLIFVFGVGIEALFYGSIIGIIIVLPWIYANFLKEIFDKKRTDNLRGLFSQTLKYSLPLVFANLVYWILSLSDRYMIQFFRGAEEVGIYSASYKIGEYSIMLIVSLFMLAVGPIIINLWEKEGGQRACDMISRIARYYILIATPAVFGLIFLSKNIVQIMTGSHYHQGYTVLPFIALSIYFLGFAHRFGESFVLTKNTKYIMFIILAGAVINIILNFIFVPIYGYFAAAVTTLIGYLIMLVLYIYFSRKFLKWSFPISSLVKSVLASLIMGFVVYFVITNLHFSNLLNLTLVIFLGFVVYGALIFLFKELSSQEILFIKNLKKYVH